MNKRQKLIEQYIFEKKEATMHELVDYFKVSMNTIRSDIKILEENNVVKKKYGGVRSTSNLEFTAFDIRRTKAIEEKKEISKIAASLIEMDDVIFVDSGTTLMYILDSVADDLKFTVITHNYSVISSGIDKTEITLISLPGVFERKTRSYFDTNTSSALRRYNIDKAFIAATTVGEQGNLCNTSYVERDIKSAALEISSKSYLLADSTKFGKSSLMTFGSIIDLNGIITDSKVPNYIQETCELNNIELLMVPNSSQI